MATTTPHRIALIVGDENRDEAYAVAALKPGHILEKVSTGKVQKNSVTAAAGVYRERLIALEDALQAKTITDAYAADDLVSFLRVKPGDLVLARLPAAATAVVIGSLLMVDATGCVVLRTTTLPVFAAADEAIDNSAGGAEAFVRIRIL